MADRKEEKKTMIVKMEDVDDGTIRSLDVDMDAGDSKSVDRTSASGGSSTSGGSRSDGKDAKDSSSSSLATTVKGLGLGDGGDELVTLVSSDEKHFKLKKKHALESGLIKTMSDGDPKEDQFPLPNIHSKILPLVIAYVEHHDCKPVKEVEKPLKTANLAEVVEEWDAKLVDFVDVKDAKEKIDLLFDLILAANYMDIKPLLELCCIKVASMLKGKTPEQIRSTFFIINDFTPDEEAAVKAENSWAEEAPAAVPVAAS